MANRALRRRHGEGNTCRVIGRLLVTDLHEYAAPWLRQDLGHRGRLLSDPCLCGRSLPLLELSQ